jgi:TMEM175 potassium channel family protein
MAQHENVQTEDIIENTARVEIFSDAIYAIVATLLVLELRVPVVEVTNSAHFLDALRDMAPEFVAFTFSFLIIVIYWVNHLYLFHHLQRINWRCIWYNNFHLFWIATIPFTTAFIGKYHTSTVPVALYAIDMTMAATSILLMAHYASFKAHLLYPGFEEEQLKREFRRALAGPTLYAVAALAAFLNVYISIVIFLATPVLFVVPRLLANKDQ